MALVENYNILLAALLEFLHHINIRIWQIKIKKVMIEPSLFVM
jgi:hypothetical protein